MLINKKKKTKTNLSVLSFSCATVVETFQIFNLKKILNPFFKSEFFLENLESKRGKGKQFKLRNQKQRKKQNRQMRRHQNRQLI